ncbi:glycoside hydrolase family 73 protein [Blattabacterium cuenoti]|uniref:glycoside hydrolase family 73 protein n=1 Tax=Blattabacterium cuenoti TaxID=1653831 RepID=UPI00163D2348|nr:glucosaminidase domain-containing protein [Blattabacterium cuenoti]
MIKKISFYSLFFFTFIFSLSSKEIERKIEEKEKRKKKIVQYIEKYAILAIEEMEKYGIPASVKLAQAIIESSNGSSILSNKTNNHFGIKCGKNWIGKVYHHDDDLPQECFRKYPSVEESFNDHSIFLKKSQRYSKLFFLKKRDYKAWAIGLKKAGYATSLKYSDQIINQIEKYMLWLLDSETSSSFRMDKYLRETKKQKNVIINLFFRISLFYKIFIYFI